MVTLVFLVEGFPCENRYKLEARERYHIENTKCVNKILPTRTSKEYYDQNKENREKERQRHKAYYEQNKEKENQRIKQYKERNKEQIKHRETSYRERNKDQIKQRQTEYREQNKEKYIALRKIKYEQNKSEVCDICCACSAKSNLRRHQKSKKCQSFLQAKEEGNEQDV